MFCIRCKMIVKSELDKLGVASSVIGFGEVKLKNGISTENREKLKSVLEKSGFDLLEDHEGRLIEKIKSIVIERVHFSDEEWRSSFPEYLSRRLKQDYSYISNLFYEVKNITIQNFFISHKIERAKELLVYYKLNLTEVALQLNYRNIIHLSNQFRDVTGFSPCHFQEIKDIRHATQQKVRMM
jgi:AraC-like DNA-binding protein